MRFDIRIIEEENKNAMAVIKSPYDVPSSFGFNTVGYSLGKVELPLYEKIVSFTVHKTIICASYDDDSNCRELRQSLQTDTYVYNKKFYLRATLADKKPTLKVEWRTKGNSKGKDIFLPIIPRTNLDYLQIKDVGCYQCQSIVFSENGIRVVTEEDGMTLETFEHDFYNDF